MAAQGCASQDMSPIKANLSTRVGDATASDDEQPSRKPRQPEPEPRGLVCQRCWDEVFTSDDFAKACWGERGSNGSSLFEYHVPVGKLLQSATTGCNWCQLILRGEGQARVELASLSPSTLVLISFHNRRREDEDIKNGYNYFALGLMRRAYWDLSACADSGNVALNFIKARRLEPMVKTEEAFEKARAWIRECEFHEHCFEQKMTVLPTRVIEVSPVENPDHPKLLATSGLGRYGALSYCWGQQHTGVTTSANLQSRLSHINQDELSQSIRDAILCTKKLGLKYLWVDAICIIQDSDDDMARELVNMRNIYQQSHITIVAASSASARDGFLRDRAETIYFDVPFPCPSSEVGIMSLAEGRYCPEKEPIHRRGWTLQEYLLSPRLLLYASNGLQYKCHTVALGLGDSRDSRDYRLPPYYFRPRRQRLKLTSERILEVLHDWAWVVNEFTHRDLSCPGDKLSALAGIAELFSNLLRVQYICGLWDVQFLQQLLWTVELPERQRPVKFRAPSWSWASVDDPVWYDRWRPFVPFRCELLDCQIILQSASVPFGAATSGQLRLRGALRKAWYKRPFSILLDQIEDPATIEDIAAHSDDESTIYDSDDFDGLRESRPFARLDTRHDKNTKPGWVYCLIIGQRHLKSERLREHGKSTCVEGLMLLPISPGTMTFRRIGSFSQKGGDLGADWPRCVVTIV